MLAKYLTSMGVYGAIAMAAVGGAEIIARTYDWMPRASDTPAGDNLGRSRYDYSPTGYGDLVANQDGYWEIWFHRPYHVQTNSIGLRNTEEPSDKAFRILAVGDSQTFGPYLANEDTWPAWAENYLRQKSGRVGAVQVFNAGIAGYSLADEVAYLRDKGVNFKPHLVLLAATERTFFSLRYEIAHQLRRPTSAPRSHFSATLKAVGDRSALLALADQIKARIKIAAVGVDVHRGGDKLAMASAAVPPEPSRQAMVARSAELLSELVALLERHGIRHGVIFIPSAGALGRGETSEPESDVRAIARQAGTPYLDLTPHFHAQPDAFGRMYLLQRDVASGGLVGNAHLSREGNAVIGKAVADWLVESNLMPH
jgi:lysophospholipase L1-like esterase